MRLRICVEFIGLEEVKITKFSGNVTIKVKDIVDHLFDFDSFKLVDRRSATDFCLGIWGGEGTLEEPWELAIHKRNYDTGRHEIVEFLHAKDKRTVTVEQTIMP